MNSLAPYALISASYGPGGNQGNIAAGEAVAQRAFAAAIAGWNYRELYRQENASDMGMKISMRLDHGWLLSLGLASATYCIATEQNLFYSSILISGCLCVALIAIGRKEGYLVGLYNSCAYALVAYRNGLFGETMLNLLFFVPTGIIGFFMWKRHSAEKVVSMRQLSWRARAVTGLICLICITVLGGLLNCIPTQNTPFIDASTNILSIIATFLMMWRYKEQWLLYMALNVITVIMWLLRWQANGVAGDTMIVMWLLFLLNSIFGFWRWSMAVKAEVAA